MRNLLTLALLAAVALLWSGTAQADSFSFGLEPPGGAVSGAAGSTVGWGYQVTNDSSDWLLLVDINSTSSFTTGDPSALLGVAAGNPVPLIAPSGTQTVAYDPTASTGLFALAFNSNESAGSSDSGQFDLTGWFFSDPDFMNFVGVDDEFADFSASVVATPEPASIFLLGAGLIIWTVKRKWSAAA